MSIKPGATKEPRVKKKKPDELLASVVRETAVPAALEVLRGNERFAFPSGTAWVILLLEAQAIGGLSKKQSRDEAKGSLIQLIDSDQISTLATADMLQEEVFGIIPTPGTLDRMSEYHLLTSAEYVWAVVSQPDSAGLRVDTIANGTYNQAVAISGGHDSLREALGDDVWATYSGESPDEVVAEDAGTQETVIPEDDDLEAVLGDETPDFEDEPEAFVDEPEAFEESAPVVDEPASDEVAPAPAEAVESDEYDDDTSWDESDGIDEVPLEDQEPVADQATLRSNIARRFLSEDLDLQIGLDDFVTSFSADEPIVQIDVPESTSTWLGDQVTHLIRQANAELTRLHQAGQEGLQSQYVHLMGLHAEQVVREVSVDREGSVYKRLFEAASEEHRERLSGKDEKIRKQNAKILEEIEKQARRVGEQAAIEAETKYRERNRAKVQRDQMESTASITAEIENEYTFAQQEILRLRRKDAEAKMFVGQTRIFEILTEQQARNHAAEKELLEHWRAEITRVIDQHRKDDIARSEVLAEEQSRNDRVGLLQAEHEQAIERLRVERVELLRRMEEEFERDRVDHAEALRLRDEEWQHRLDLEKSKTEAEVKRNADFVSQRDQIEASIKRQYDARVAELEADRQRHASEMAAANSLQSRSNKIITALVVALPILGVLAGIVIGQTF